MKKTKALNFLTGKILSENDGDCVQFLWTQSPKGGYMQITPTLYVFTPTLYVASLFVHFQSRRMP